MRFRKPTSSVILLSTLLAATSATNAAAQNGYQDSYSGVYVNIGVSQLSADLDLSNLDLQGNTVDLGEETAKVIMLNGRVGYRLNKYIALEGDAGFGIGGDNFQRSIPVNVNPLGVVNIDADADLDVKNYFGAFARGILPVSDQFDIFLRGGYGTAKAEASAIATTTALPGFSTNFADSQSAKGFAYGIGAEYHINERHGIRADFSAIGSEAQFISLAYAVKF